MIRHLLLLVLILALYVSSALAQRQRCDLEGECVPGNPPTGLASPHVPIPPGGSPPTISLSEQEPYRSPQIAATGVVLSTGEFQITVTDLEIPGRGFPFKLTRTYRSRRDGKRSVLGYNWHLGYDEYLRPGNCADGLTYNAIEWHMGNGFSDVWTNCSSPPEGYKPFQGFFGGIRDLGTDGPYQIRYPDGTIKTFGQMDEDEVTGDEIWVLTKIEDRNGNVMTFQIGENGAVERVIDTLGRVITFNYSADGTRLTSVTDFMGRTVEYKYEAAGLPDLLTSVTSPTVTVTATGRANTFPEGKVTRYEYLGQYGCEESWMKYNLKLIKDGKSQVFLTNTYYHHTDSSCGVIGLPADAIASQDYGGGTIGYQYTNVSPGGTANANTINTQATVTDRNGNIEIHKFNLQGNPLTSTYFTNRSVRTAFGGTTIPEGDYVVTHSYVIDDFDREPMLVSRRTESGGYNIDQDGNLGEYLEGSSIEYEYYDHWGNSPTPDRFQKGNVRYVRRTPGSRGAPVGQDVLLTSYEYEPLFNQVVTITDPRGHATRMTYDYQEDTYSKLISVISGQPAPATVHPDWWPYDDVENWMASAANANLGDRNGDGESGYSRRGSLIEAKEEGTILGADGSPSEPIVTLYRYNSFGLPKIICDAELNESHFRYYREDDPDGDTNPTTPNPPPDGRSLSSVEGEGGGGYLKEKVLDATPQMAVPPGTGRNHGFDIAPANVLLSFKYDDVGNVTQATDGRGVETHYMVNELNQVVEIMRAAVVLAEPGMTAYRYLEQLEFDANNNLLRRHVERRDDIPQAPDQGRWITAEYEYDLLDRRIRETITTNDTPSPPSITTRFKYDANGNLIKTVYPARNVVLRKYDERNLLYQEAAIKSCTDTTTDLSECNTADPAVDSVTQYDYDGSGSLIQVMDPEGHITRTGYDGYGRKVVAFDPAYQNATFAYDLGSNLVNQVVRGTTGGFTPTSPPVTPYPVLSEVKSFFDELGRLRRRDAMFEPQHKDLNAGLTGVVPNGTPASQDGWTTSYVVFDRLGRVIKSVDDNGHATEIRYDGLGRKIKLLANAVCIAGSVPACDPIEHRNAVDYTYDKNGNVTLIDETEFGFDRTASTPRILLDQHHQSGFTYDAMNRQATATLIGRVGATVNLTTTTHYDSRGNRLQVTDPAGGRTKFEFDYLGRLTKKEGGWNGPSEELPANMINTSNPDGKITTTYTYDDNGRLLTLKDDNNKVTSYLYDNLNRPTRITYPNSSYRQATYNKDSLPTLWEQANTQGFRIAVTTLYDDLHRPKQKDADNTQALFIVGTMRQNFEYDGLGRITKALDDSNTSSPADSEVSFAYNSQGKVISETQSHLYYSNGQWLQKPNTVDSSYDGVGFRTEVIYPPLSDGNPVRRKILYTPDELNRPKDLCDSFLTTCEGGPPPAPASLFRYDYVGPGRVLNRFSPNGTSLTMLSDPTDPVGQGYDGARRVVDFANKLGSAPLVQYTYDYDAVGNRKHELRVHEPADTLDPHEKWKGEEFIYDAVYRLVNRKEADLNGSLAVIASTVTQDFILDGVGNWKTHKRNASTYNQTINSLNQYTVFNGPAGQRSLYYNFIGNLENEALPQEEYRQYTYDFLNRLAHHLGEGYSGTDYRYDALGRRTFKSVNGLVTRYVYDGAKLIEERDGENAVQVSYVLGLGSDEVLSRRHWDGETPFDLFYHTNALGSVTAVTDSSGVVVERYKYDAYGQVTFLTPTFTPLTMSALSNRNNVLFTGRYLDTESGLYYYRARTYHPYLGRFLQRDPLGEAAGINLYNYVFNNPVNATDPSGMMSAEQRRMSVIPQSSGSRNPFCMAGLCGGGGSSGSSLPYPSKGTRGPRPLMPGDPGASIASAGSSGDFIGSGGVSTGGSEAHEPQFQEKVSVNGTSHSKWWVDPANWWAEFGLEWNRSATLSTDFMRNIPDLRRFNTSLGKNRNVATGNPGAIAKTQLPTGYVAPFAWYVLQGMNPLPPLITHSTLNVTIPLATIYDGAGPAEFPGFLDTVEAMSPGTIQSVEFKYIFDQGVPGLGEETVVLGGTMHKSCSGNVAFSGWITGTGNVYNFNRTDTARNAFWTFVGNSIPGQEFSYEFVGQRWVTYP